MNPRGLSYWMLPSQPVSRLGYSRLAKVRSQQLVPGGASISLTSQRASPSRSLPATISCLDLSNEPGSRLSESNDAFPRHASEELTPPHARKPPPQLSDIQASWRGGFHIVEGFLKSPLRRDSLLLYIRVRSHGEASYGVHVPL